MWATRFVYGRTGFDHFTWTIGPDTTYAASQWPNSALYTRVQGVLGLVLSDTQAQMNALATLARI